MELKTAMEFARQTEELSRISQVVRELASVVPAVNLLALPLTEMAEYKLDETHLERFPVLADLLSVAEGVRVMAEDYEERTAAFREDALSGFGG